MPYLAATTSAHTNSSMAAPLQDKSEGKFTKGAGTSRGEHAPHRHPPVDLLRYPFVIVSEPRKASAKMDGVDTCVRHHWRATHTQ